MTPDELRQLLQEQQLTQREAAEIMLTNTRRVEAYVAGDAPLPAYRLRLLLLELGLVEREWTPAKRRGRLRKLLFG